jgi:EmrB/QacA subfamily drug resistance transporter
MEAANTENKLAEQIDRPHVILSSRRRWAVTAGVLLGMFLAALEATVVGAAMPTIIASLGGMDRYSWVVSAYLLTATVTVPIWGKLSDIYGRRPLYLAGVSTFLLGSALSGASQTMTQLIIFRAVQGLGAGALVPLSLTINGDIFTPQERTRIQGLFSGMWGLASIIGPLAGGFITDKFSWHWVFYINIPFGLAAAIIVGLALVEPKRAEQPVVDYAGAAWLTFSITALLIALIESAHPEMWTSPLMIVSGLSFILFGILFIRAEKRAVEPIVPLSLFRNRMVAVGSITSFLTGTAMFGSITFVPLLVQGAWGGTATQAGSALTPFLLGWVGMAIVGGKLMLRVGYRSTVLTGLGIMAASFVILSTFGINTPRWLLLANLGLMGSGMGMVMLALLITIQSSVERQVLGVATSLQQFSRSIGGAVGVAIMGAVLTISLMSHRSDIQRETHLPQAEVEKIVNNISDLMRPETRAKMPQEALRPLAEGLSNALQNAFIVGAFFAGLGFLSGFWLPSFRATASAKAVEEAAEMVSSSKECERMLMSEMTTIDAENEPAAVEPKADANRRG